MDLRRVRVWEWLTGLAGLVLLVALFLPWYGDDSAWEALAIADVLLGIVGLLAVAYVFVTAAQRTAAVPQTWVALVLPLAIVALLVVLFRLVDAPDAADSTRGIGVWLGLLGALGSFAFSYRSMGDQRFPESMRPKLDLATIPTPTADGERRDLS